MPPVEVLPFAWDRDGDDSIIVLGLVMGLWCAGIRSGVFRAGLYRQGAGFFLRAVGRAERVRTSEQLVLVVVLLLMLLSWWRRY